MTDLMDVLPLPRERFPYSNMSVSILPEQGSRELSSLTRLAHQEHLYDEVKTRSVTTFRS